MRGAPILGFLMASLFKRKNVPEGVDPARIPPGQTLTAPDRWPLLHFGPVPKTDIARWAEVISRNKVEQR